MTPTEKAVWSEAILETSRHGHEVSANLVESTVDDLRIKIDEPLDIDQRNKCDRHCGTF